MNSLTCSTIRVPRACWKYAGWFFLLAVALFVVGSVMSVSAKKAVSGVGWGLVSVSIALLVTALILTFVALFAGPTARLAKRCLDEFENGKFLVHWQLTSDDVRQDAQLQYRALRRNAWIYFWVTTGVGAVVAGALGGGLWLTVGRNTALSIIIIGVAGSALLGWVIRALCMMRANRRLRRSLAAAGEIYIGESGGYFSGEFIPWATSRRRLTVVKFTPGAPAILEFNIHWSMGAWGLPLLLLAIFGGRAIVTETDIRRRIAVPAGHETEAQGLERYFMQVAG